MSRKSPDIRPPCGGNNQRKFYGPCFNQRNSNLEGIPIKQNTTVVPTYESGSSGWVAPYSRPENDAAPNCSPYYFPYECGDDAAPNGELACGVPTTASIGFNGTTFNVGTVYQNSYVQTATTTSYSSCRSMGTKHVFAKKAWQGKYIYASRTYGLQDELTWCCSCGIHHYDADPPTTKYLALSSVAEKRVTRTDFNESSDSSGEICCPDEWGNVVCGPRHCTSRSERSTTVHYASANNSVHMDKYGNQYVDSWSGTWSGFDGPEDPAGIAFLTDVFLKLGLANGNIVTIVSAFCDPTLWNIGAPDVHSSDSQGAYAMMGWQTMHRCFTECGELVSETPYNHTTYEINLTAGTLIIETYGVPSLPGCPGACHSPILTSRQVFTYGSTGMSWVLDAHAANSVSFDEVTRASVRGTLSQPYTITEVQEETKELLSYWPLDNDILLPWRVELDRMGPIVSYYEGGGEPFINPYISSSAQFSNPYGRLMGLPAPTGIDRVWNPEHRNYDSCMSFNDIGAECYSKYTKTWGAWSDSIGIPHATKWLTQWEAIQMPQGAFIGMNFFWSTPSSCNTAGPNLLGGDEVYMCKYAEVIIPERRSHNYARPCGIDRWQMAQSSARCIVSTDGTVLDLEPSGDPTDINTGDLVWVCGDGGGCYVATKNNDYQITLGQCIASASMMPQQPLAECGTGMVGKLRWGNTLKPAICGRVDITSISNTNPVTCSLMEGTHLTNSDQVTVVGAVPSNINGTWPITVLSPTEIVLMGSTGTATPFTQSTGQMYSPGAADWAWNDNAPKHEYQVLQWTFNRRDVGEYNRIESYNNNNDTLCNLTSDCPTQANTANPRAAQAALGLDQGVSSMDAVTSCQTVNACRPMVAFFSPNGETFSHTGSVMGAVNYGFPDVTCDAQGAYGGIKWNGVIQQTTNDPLWIAPPCPCAENILNGQYGCLRDPFEGELPWDEDNGSCESGGYPHAPQVEARAEIPTGAPALPTGVYVGCLTPAEIAGGAYLGNICGPPYHDPNYYIATPGMAFQTLWDYPPYHSLFLAERNCICFGGAYAANYLLDGVTCS
jgi:hypothetical protein